MVRFKLEDIEEGHTQVEESEKTLSPTTKNSMNVSFRDSCPLPTSLSTTLPSMAVGLGNVRSEKLPPMAQGLLPESASAGLSAVLYRGGFGGTNIVSAPIVLSCFTKCCIYTFFSVVSPLGTPPVVGLMVF